jgi:chromosome segregation protein
MVEARSQVDQIESKISHLRELREEIDHSIEAKKVESENAAEQIRVSAEKIEELEAALKQVFADRNEANERQTRLRADQGEIQKRVSELEDQLQQARNDKDAISEETHQLEIRLNTLDSESQSLIGRIEEEYEVDLTAIEPERPEAEMSDEEAREHLARQKEKLKKFGAVNLLALEEYKTAVEREEFLKEQLDDLTQAKDDLQSTIRQINRRARQMFNETFAKVRENFQKLFVQLFTGGEADISLEEPDNPLESDIIITARPRGKKLLSITMMSGGERALTAIALLFSLYLVKPSPFCILDEIDAPLDDANCRRFLNIIAGFAEQTQFIIITHNKITMSTADNLYGVTMEQAGISELVAVRFADVQTSASGELLIVDHTPPEELEPADDETEPPAEVTEEVESVSESSSEGDNRTTTDN